ncbi:hypothetical protein DFH06DRAFT_1350101 [Mycena polygramma]|nr:hypothetical protein DFH06DRAFT_1350101 [Mycena polygramma]
MFKDKMKFPKRAIFKTAERVPAPALKPLLLVDCLLHAQEPKLTPKKSCNPATRLLRVLGLKKKKKSAISADYVVCHGGATLLDAALLFPLAVPLRMWLPLPSLGSRHGCVKLWSLGLLYPQACSSIPAAVARLPARKKTETLWAALDPSGPAPAQLSFSSQTDPEEPCISVVERITVQEVPYTKKLTVDVASATDPEAQPQPPPVTPKKLRTVTAECGVQADLVEQPTTPAAVPKKTTMEMGSQTEPEKESEPVIITNATGPIVSPSPSPSSPSPSPTSATTSLTDGAASWSRVKRDSSGLLDELKDRLARRNTHATTSSSPPIVGQSTLTAAPKFALRSRRPVQKENVEPEEGELQQVFRSRKLNGAARAPFGSVDRNVDGAKSGDQPTFGARKIRRIVVPPVEVGSVPSRDPRIQHELDQLRAQAKVGGAGGSGAGKGAPPTNIENTEKNRKLPPKIT